MPENYNGENNCHPQNQSLAEQLNVKINQLRATGNIHRAANYSQVLSSVRAYPLPISTRDDGSSLLGAGPSVSHLFERSLDPVAEDDLKEYRKTFLKRAHECLLDACESAEINVDDLPKLSDPPKKKKSAKPKHATAKNVAGSPPVVPVEEKKLIRTETEFIGIDKIELIVLLDTREVGGNRIDKGGIQDQLLRRDLQVKIYQLPVADVMWVAQATMRLLETSRLLVGPTLGALEKGLSKEIVEIKEYVLPFAIERKTVADMVSSIKDGRYKSQKRKLEDCFGLRKIDAGARPVLLLENNSEEKDTGGATFSNIWRSKKITQQELDSCKSAIVNTNVRDGFPILFSDSIAHSANLISEIHTFLTETAFPDENDASGWYCRKIRRANSSRISIGNLSQLDCHQQPNSAKDTMDKIKPIEFETWNEAQKTSQKSSVKILFGQHLRLIPGVRQLAVEAILLLAASPRALGELLQLFKDNDVFSQLVEATHCKMNKLPNALDPSISAKLFDSFKNKDPAHGVEAKDLVQRVITRKGEKIKPLKKPILTAETVSILRHMYAPERSIMDFYSHCFNV